ncbi:ATP phosphoribosyltransferase [Chloroflexota bacterium]
MSLKIALPKGRLIARTAELLRKADWGLSTYYEGTRVYRPKSKKFPGLLAKVFHEKDIPIQVAVGNYDLGICGLDWIEELMIKYPSSSLVKLRNLEYGEGSLYVVNSKSRKKANLEELRAETGLLRIASEYPNLSESFALNARLRQFSIFPLWGAAEAYPPESADLALISRREDEPVFDNNLSVVGKIIDFGAYLIANKNSWESKNLSQLLASIEDVVAVMDNNLSQRDETGVRSVTGRQTFERIPEDTVRLALPDGHQQTPTTQLLEKAGIRMEDYPSETGNHRPGSNLEGVVIKVIRPQDMPLQVANGNFDLAITGRDWLTDHFCQFPSSPVNEFLNLGFGGVKIVAVVDKELPVENAYDLKQLYAERTVSIRVASEYVNIADKYAIDNHFGKYRVIPTWGATEAFLPEDADLLIENTETGRTIARNNLKIIDTLFASTACLVGNKNSISSVAKGERIKLIIETLKGAVEVLN